MGMVLPHVVVLAGIGQCGPASAVSWVAEGGQVVVAVGSGPWLVVGVSVDVGARIGKSVWRAGR